MAKQVILTGIRANNDLHIGNYFGAMLPMIDMAKTRSADYQINMFIPDLHSFTTPIDHSKLYEAIINNARVYVAAGLPLYNDSIFLYRQSRISAHSEMTWILDCFTGFGQLERMTQFRDKSGIRALELKEQELETRFKELIKPISFVHPATGRTSIAIDSMVKSPDVHKFFEILVSAMDIRDTRQKNMNSTQVGLFNYPVLMASDIMLYNAKYVPVGDDQTQHLEFTRDIAERMNSKFGELFTVPEPVKKQHEFFGKDQGLRIKDLVDPSKKMSKSDDTGKGVIFLSDTPDEARKKIMSATTDDKANVAYDKQAQPGISNLLEVLTLAKQANGQQVTLQQVIDEFKGQSRYGDFKKVVADEVVAFLVKFQAAYNGVDMVAVEQKLAASEAAMQQVANETLLRVQKAVGLRK